MKFEARHMHCSRDIERVNSFNTVKGGLLRPIIISTIIALSNPSNIETVLNLDLSGMMWTEHPQCIIISIDPFEVADSANPEKPP